MQKVCWRDESTVASFDLECRVVQLSEDLERALVLGGRFGCDCGVAVHHNISLGES